MNNDLQIHTRRGGMFAMLLVLSAAALAGPGAHGPNGEHLDGPTSSVNAKASPRIEAKSELFELVGTLAGGELSILIDRYATNEPLLKAEVEVESDGVKAKAKFHDDIGDFSVDDPAMLKKLSTPGEHAIVITVLSGDEADLLDGVLRVATQGADGGHGHGHDGHEGHEEGHEGRWSPWVAGGAALLAVLGALVWRRRHAKPFGVQNNGGQA